MKRIIMAVLAILTAASLYAAKVNVDYWVATGRGGLSYPIMEMGNNFTGGFNGGISVRKGLDSETQVGGGFTFLQIPYKLTAAPEPFSATVIDIEAVYSPYMPDFFIWPYAKVLIGLYLLKYAKLDTSENSVMASETGFGFGAGLGANYPINNMISANVEILFNQASLAGGTGDNFTFVTFDAGITMFLK